MNPNLLHQELARQKHAEILREASIRYARKVDAAPEPQASKPRSRLRRPSVFAWR